MIGTVDALVDYKMIARQGSIYKRSASCSSLAELHKQICLEKKAKLLGQYAEEEEESPGNSDESLLDEEKKSSEELSEKRSSRRSVSNVDNQVILLSEDKYFEDPDEELLRDYDYVILPYIDPEDSDPEDVGATFFILPTSLYSKFDRVLEFVIRQKELEGEILKAPKMLKLSRLATDGISSFLTFMAENEYGAIKTFRAEVWEGTRIKENGIIEDVMVLEQFATKPDGKSSQQYVPTMVGTLAFPSTEFPVMDLTKMSRKTLDTLMESYSFNNFHR